MVARMSWWPDTSSRVAGRYFSTLSHLLGEMVKTIERKD